MKLFDCEGEQIDKTIGDPEGNGASGTITEEWIGLRQGQKIIQVGVIEAKDPGDPEAFMIGKIFFSICEPASASLKDGYYWGYSGPSMNWEDTEKLIKEKEG